MSTTGSVDETLVTSPAGGGRESAVVLARGDTVGRYVVIDKLGAGGMGVVHAAYDPELDRKLAIKLLRAGGRGEAATEGRARLQREARAMARLQHPNVIAVHDVGEHAGQVFVAMEFVDGLTLRDWNAAASRGWREVLQVLGQAGQGLAAAHDAGLVHRDFKADNVMVGNDGRVRVLDFGLARAGVEASTGPVGPTSPDAVDVLSSELTRVGAAVGTPAYMSPEQHEGKVVDARSDQFSFCVALYEALYGERPFAGDSPMAIAFNVSQGKIRDAPASTTVPGWLRRVVVRGLAVDPQARYPSMSALLHDLGRDPTRSRRRWAGGLALVAVIAGGLGTHAAAEARARETCVEQGEAIHGVWDDRARARLDEALTSGGAPHAKATRDRTVEWIDRHVQAWSEARTRLCVAHEIEEDRRPETRTRAELCLDEARGSLEHLLEVLASDPGAARRAVRAAAALPRPEQCTDADWLARHAVPPEDPATREAIAAVRRQIAAVVTLHDLGRYADAVAAARDAVTAATETGWPPVEAHARAQLGAALERDGKYEDAQVELERAYVTAAAAGADVVATQAGGLLAYVAGFQLKDVERARLWTEVSGAMMRRANLEDTLRGASWIQSIAATRYAAGEYGEAREMYEQAERIRARELGDEHPVTLNSRMNIAVTASQLGNYDEARALLEQNIDALGQAIGPEHPDLATDLGTLAQTCARLGDTEAAVAHARRAMKINEGAFGPGHLTTAKSMINLANATADDEEAARLYRKALPVLENAVGKEHPWVAGVINNLGLVEHRAGNLKDARALLERTLQIQKTKPGDDHPATAQTRANLAAVHQDLGDHAGALAYLRAALPVREKALGDQHLDVAWTRFRMARSLWEVDGTGHDRARSLARRAREAFAAADEADRVKEIDAWLVDHGGPVQLPTG